MPRRSRGGKPDRAKINPPTRRHAEPSRGSPSNTAQNSPLLNVRSRNHPTLCQHHRALPGPHPIPRSGFRLALRVPALLLQGGLELRQRLPELRVDAVVVAGPEADRELRRAVGDEVDHQFAMIVTLRFGTPPQDAVLVEDVDPPLLVRVPGRQVDLP